MVSLSSENQFRVVVVVVVSFFSCMGMHFRTSQWCVLLMILQLNFELSGSELHVDCGLSVRGCRHSP